MFYIEPKLIPFASLTLRQNLSLVSLSSLLKDLCGEDICLSISFLLRGKESPSSLSNLNFLQSLITPLGPKRDKVGWESGCNKRFPEKFVFFAGLSFCASVFLSFLLPKHSPGVLRTRAFRSMCPKKKERGFFVTGSLWWSVSHQDTLEGFWWTTWAVNMDEDIETIKLPCWPKVVFCRQIFDFFIIRVFKYLIKFK